MKSKLVNARVWAVAGCLVCALLLALPTIADQPEETPAVAVAEPAAEAPVDLPETTPAPEERIFPPQYGPCSMSFLCPNGLRISCSGQNYCRMGFIHVGGTPYHYLECDGRRVSCAPTIE